MTDFTTAPPHGYGGFWRRFLALFIDTMILGAACGVLSQFVPFIDTRSFTASTEQGLNFSVDMTPAGFLITLVGSWLYFALLEASPRGATVGKMALSLRVTALDGRRMSFLQATGRYFAKFISGVIMGIGYIMAAFTARKQALHDIIAGTVVVKTAG
jgi:uncharacterized RDD family membrane protein YckC